MSGPPEEPKDPHSAMGARQGRISGRVVTVLAISFTLAIVGMALSYLVW